MTFEEIMNNIRNRKYVPIYLLMGEEPWFIDQVSDLLQETVLDEGQKAFNLNIVYGKDLDGTQIDNIARRFPMGAEYNMVVVKEAQSVQKIDNLQYYAQNPLRSTILVLCYKNDTLDKRKKLYKAIEQNGVVLLTKKIYEDQIPRWIEGYLKKKGYHIEPGAAMILTEYLGNDLARVSGEIDKLLITLPAGQIKITPAHIEENSGISKDFNSFELVKALSRKNILKANRIINYLADNQRDNHISLTISSLFYFFGKLLAYQYLEDKSTRSVTASLGINAYFVPDYEHASRLYPKKKVLIIISLLREYDLKSKGFGNVSAEPGDLLKELIFKILH
ncbi:MAG: DNA polymerase III subunit delta [Bacteroidetes bacterium GWF2_49_14]|nr:MAG: DNA polymerase III subunit delta [Bacteroidetes bacterium GWF2_49_14]HBB90735.1 DNA polymerase III subunit delta [Bacteroidales bacterium]